MLKLTSNYLTVFYYLQRDVNLFIGINRVLYFLMYEN